MRNLLEKAIVHLLNGDQDKAEALFHKFMVERAREIHESLRQNEDVQLSEGWDNEIHEEEYFDDLGHEDNGEEAEVGGEPAMDAVDADADVDADVADADADMADADADMADAETDLDGAEGDEAHGEGEIEAKLDGIEAKMDELSAEFDRLMAELGGDGDLEGDDLGDEFGDEDLDGDEDEFGGEADEFGGEHTADEEAGEETDDLADRMEDDMSDEDQPEHEVTEEQESDEMLDDITESVLADLEKVTVPSESDGKEIGSGGKTVSGNHTDSLPSHPVNDRVNQAKPYMVKGGNNDSFERETPPSNKEVKRRRNNDAGVKKLTKVPPKGDGSAKLNSDFASRPATQSTVDGKKSK